jgi:hypothetical protein
MVNVLVLGAGRRVKGAVLPALGCLEDRFRVAAVCSRSPVEIAWAGGRRRITTTTLDRVDVAGIDLIVMAVSLRQNARVLAQLAAMPVGGAVLLLDTPVLPPAGLAAARHFSAFRRVLVAEDTLALPPFLLARRLIDDGAIGRLERIFFFHCGYKHHAMASLKLLAGAPIRRIVDRKFAGKMRQKLIDFASGAAAVMYEPRDYATGKFLLRGESGAIADYDYDVAPVRRIGYQVDGPIYRGLTLDGEPVPPAGLDQAYLDHVGGDVFDASLMNTMKLRGLMDLLVAALEPSSPFHYDPADALCDHLSARLVDRIGYLPAPHRFRHLVALAEHLPGGPRAPRPEGRPGQEPPAGRV